MIHMFISVMLNTVFEDGQYHKEQIKLEFRINEICYGSMYNAYNFNLYGMLALLLARLNNVHGELLYYPRHRR